jgi:hypothetical protein
MDSNNLLFINQFEQIHGRRQSVPTLLSELSDNMTERSKADKFRKIALASPLKRVANFFDHITGTDKRHRERWSNSHGAHVIERCSEPTSIHNTALYDHMRAKRRIKYEECYSKEGVEKFWAIDHRPTWRTIRMPDYSKAEPLFSIYRSTATYIATSTKNTRVATKYYLVCDDIVNFFVLREMSKSTPSELRSRMWRLWSMGHNFNVPVELELPLIRNCVDVAVLLCMAYTSEELMDDREVMLVDETLDDITLLGNQEVYTPKFRMMEDNDSVIETMLRKVDNRRLPRESTIVNVDPEDARAALLRDTFTKSLHETYRDVDVESPLEEDDDFVDVTDDPMRDVTKSSGDTTSETKPTVSTVVDDQKTDVIIDNQKKVRSKQKKPNRGKKHQKVATPTPMIVEGQKKPSLSENNSNNQAPSRFNARATSGGRSD